MKDSAPRTVLAQATAAFLAATSTAQLIYVDDFSGATLDPRWGLSSHCAACEYDVNFGMMNITRLPQVAPCGDTRVRMTDYFPTLRNGFDISAAVIWEAGIPQSIGLAVQSAGGPYYGSITYFGDTLGAGLILIRLFDDPLPIELEAPGAGRHEFRLTRVGGLSSVYLDGLLLHQRTGLDLLGAISAEIAFQSSPTVQYAADLHVDRVVVAVPSPGACGVSLFALSLGAGRRSRRPDASLRLG